MSKYYSYTHYNTINAYLIGCWLTYLQLHHHKIISLFTKPKVTDVVCDSQTLTERVYLDLNAELLLVR